MKDNRDKRKFWFQNSEGKRLIAHECCVINGIPSEIIEDNTIPKHPKYLCWHCWKEILILDNNTNPE
jgi:hypothetical protein